MFRRRQSHARNLPTETVVEPSQSTVSSVEPVVEQSQLPTIEIVTSVQVEKEVGDSNQRIESPKKKNLNVKKDMLSNRVP